MKRYWKVLKIKYKLSFFNEGSLEEVWSFRLSRLSALLSLASFAFALIALTAFIIIKTPIRNYLPGYLDVEVRKEIVENALKADSLERSMEAQNLYIKNVMAIFSGTVKVDSISDIDSMAHALPNFDIPKGEAEAEFVKSFEEEEMFNLSMLNHKPALSDVLFFYKPVSGVVSAPFDWKNRHCGVDIAGKDKEGVLSTLDGTVTFTGYDDHEGYVIQVQHKNGYLSIYKQNTTLIKKIGDSVKAGETIALLGRSVEGSKNVHLHFELWHDGKPLNPIEYISF